MKIPYNSLIIDFSAKDSLTSCFIHYLLYKFMRKKASVNYFHPARLNRLSESFMTFWQEIHLHLTSHFIHYLLYRFMHIIKKESVKKHR